LIQERTSSPPPTDLFGRGREQGLGEVAAVMTDAVVEEGGARGMLQHETTENKLLKSIYKITYVSITSLSAKRKNNLCPCKNSGDDTPENQHKNKNSTSWFDP
jgi:hypothetical protein